MQKNESQTDRIIRGVVGAILLIIGLMSAGWLRIILVIVALALLITAYLGYCYLYKLLGFNSLEKPGAPKPEQKPAEPKPTEQKPPEPPQPPAQPPVQPPVEPPSQPPVDQGPTA